ncbi:MAG: hypothetical protein ACXWZ8_11825 [Gaiellaceae bacterium]
MKRRIPGLGGVITVIVAASLLVATQASAGTSGGLPAIGCTAVSKAKATRTLASARGGIQFVKGHFPAGETIEGSLSGTWIVTGFDDASFRYDQKTGVMKFQVTELFTGSINGVGGAPGDKLYFKGYVVQRFQPGTPLGTGVGDPTGTTDDASTWVGGSCLHPVTGGEGAFAGASGIIYFRDEAYFGASNYLGIIRL